MLNHHGPDVDSFIAERMAALATAGDEAGCKAWLAIAERVDQLRQMSPAGRASH